MVKQPQLRPTSSELSRDVRSMECRTEASGSFDFCLGTTVGSYYCLGADKAKSRAAAEAHQRHCDAAEILPE